MPKETPASPGPVEEMGSNVTAGRQHLARERGEQGVSSAGFLKVSSFDGARLA
jgi:hypothetical protein